MVAAVSIVCAAPAQAADQQRCTEPAEGDWQRAAPSALGLDGKKLDDALRFIDSRRSTIGLVIRHGCVAGVSPNGRGRWYTARQESWSMSKSVTALVAQRAMTLGLLSPDDRLGSILTEADKAHGDLTIEQLLRMNTGLHWNMFADYNVFNPNMVRYGLTMGFDASPGAEFNYHQTTVGLLAHVVERASGMPFQEFAQRELFGPIGIPRDRWDWFRDQAGNTRGFFGLHMRAADFARFGELMLERGSWRGRELIAPAYLRHATTNSETNAGYGWMIWLNSGDWHVPPTIMNRHVNNEPFLASLPRDAYMMEGLGDQEIVVIPSLDMVYVRLGIVASGDTLLDVETVLSSEGRHEIGRRIMRSVTDTQVADPGPYPRRPAAPITRDTPGLLTSLDNIYDVWPTLFPPPLPPAGPVRQRVPSLPFDTTVTVAADGTIPIEVGCPPVAATACTPELSLRGEDGAPVTATVRATIAPGARAEVRLPAAPAARAAGPFRARVISSTTDDGGETTSAAPSVVTIRP